MSDTRILIAYVHDRPGVLTRIAAVFYRRGLNILTLTVGVTAQPDVSKIVFRVAAPEAELRRLLLQVENLVDVIAVDIKPDTAVMARELALARLWVTANDDQALEDLLADFGARVLSRDAQSIVVEMVDSPPRIDAFIAALGPFKILDLSRTGATAMPDAMSAQSMLNRQRDNVRHLVVHLRQKPAP